MSVLNFVTQAVGQHPSNPVYAEVDVRKPAPNSFSDPLWVVFPDWNSEIPFPCDNWPAIHGQTLPATGAPCMVAFDNHNNLRVLWWDGQYS